MKVGDLVYTKFTKKLGMIVKVEGNFCCVFIPIGSKPNKSYSISKNHLEVING
jgi:hypothetical protein